MKDIQYLRKCLYNLEEKYGRRQHIEISLYDPNVDWDELLGEHADRSQPALGYGQDEDTRYDLPRGASLHAQWYREEGVVRFHLDHHNPRIDGFLHLTQETRILEGSVGGGLSGLAAGAACGLNGYGLVAALLFGIFVGGSITSQLEKAIYVWIPKSDGFFYKTTADFNKRSCFPHQWAPIIQ